ncbi:MAG: hypothetical protein K6G88_05605 [Lachnospiraceae bacterium]|nr:hypothetical protein [Lachnospiraceae bacterium]
MNYLVIELQTNEEGQTSNIVTSYNDINQAESKYYTVLAAAAISNVKKHAAVLLDAEGGFIRSDGYEH